MSALRFFPVTKIADDSTAGDGWLRQGFAPVERSAQPLAPPFARRLPRLSARAKTAKKVCARAKEKIMRLSKTLFILALALLVVRPALAEQQPTIEHRLLAETISLTANPATNPQLQIWRDQIPESAQISKISPSPAGHAQRSSGCGGFHCNPRKSGPYLHSFGNQQQLLEHRPSQLEILPCSPGRASQWRHTAHQRTPQFSRFLPSRRQRLRRHLKHAKAISNHRFAQSDELARSPSSTSMTACAPT